MGIKNDWMVEIEEVPPSEKAEQEARELQGISEGVSTEPRVTVLGHAYKVADKVGLMPLLKFAHAADQGIDSQDIEGLNAIYEMLQDCIHEGDWDRFKKEMTAEKAFVDDLLPVVQQAIQIITSRPTGEPSDSSTSSESISDGLTDGSSRHPGLVPVADLAG
jgi:hypothetical protein